MWVCRSFMYMKKSKFGVWGEMSVFVLMTSISDCLLLFRIPATSTIQSKSGACLGKGGRTHKG